MFTEVTVGVSAKSPLDGQPQPNAWRVLPHGRSFSLRMIDRQLNDVFATLMGDAAALFNLKKTVAGQSMDSPADAPI